MKHILKEIAIILLLLLVIILILAILFYDYNPTNKVIPTKITYEPPATIKEELQEEVDKTEAELKIEDRVYTIDGTDLNLYQQNKTYNSGKTNPFAATPSTDEQTSNGGTTNGNPNTSNGTSGGSTTKSPSAISENQINNNMGKNENVVKTPTKIK